MFYFFSFKLLIFLNESKKFNKIIINKKKKCIII